MKKVIIFFDIDGTLCMQWETAKIYGNPEIWKACVNKIKTELQALDYELEVLILTHKQMVDERCGKVLETFSSILTGDDSHESKKFYWTYHDQNPQQSGYTGPCRNPLYSCRDISKSEQKFSCDHYKNTSLHLVDQFLAKGVAMQRICKNRNAKAELSFLVDDLAGMHRDQFEKSLVISNQCSDYVNFIDAKSFATADQHDVAVQTVLKNLEEKIWKKIGEDMSNRLLTDFKSAFEPAWLDAKVSINELGMKAIKIRYEATLKNQAKFYEKFPSWLTEYSYASRALQIAESNLHKNYIFLWFIALADAGKLTPTLINEFIEKVYPFLEITQKNIFIEKIIDKLADSLKLYIDMKKPKPQPLLEKRDKFRQNELLKFMRQGMLNKLSDQKVKYEYQVLGLGGKIFYKCSSFFIGKPDYTTKIQGKYNLAYPVIPILAGEKSLLQSEYMIDELNERMKWLEDNGRPEKPAWQDCSSFLDDLLTECDYNREDIFSLNSELKRVTGSKQPYKIPKKPKQLDPDIIAHCERSIDSAYPRLSGVGKLLLFQDYNRRDHKPSAQYPSFTR